MCFSVKVRVASANIGFNTTIYEVLINYTYSTSEQSSVSVRKQVVLVEILVLAPPYPALINYTHTSSEHSCVSVR